MAQERDLQELQLLEQNLSQIAMQKQQFQLQLSEIESAMKELETREKAYKIVGNLLIESDKKTLVEELTGKKEVTELRIKAFEKQESKFKDKVKDLQKSVLDNLGK